MVKSVAAQIQAQPNSEPEIVLVGIETRGLPLAWRNASAMKQRQLLHESGFTEGELNDSLRSNRLIRELAYMREHPYGD